MAEIVIDGLHKRFGEGAVAVERLELTITDGELFVLLGPSGCGKTTTLRCIAGLERQTSGDIRIGGELVNDLRPAERDIAMVFQFYALYPHLTARDNVAFPLRAEGVPEAEIHERVEEAARMLRLEPMLDRTPRRLSGGEQQRVALGRAMVRKPRAFLMDEPLTNLDAELRGDMRAELKHLQERLGTTMVYVTHDQTEAMSLGHRIAIMNLGRLEQVGAPLEVYNRPRTLFCARFIGSPPMNLIELELSDGALTGPGGLRVPPPDNGLPRGARVVAGVRPERFTLVEAGRAGAVAGRIVAREALGDETIYVVDVESDRYHVRTAPTTRFDLGDPIALAYEGGPPPVYDPDSGEVVA
jgi:ABC-type sugar transport system ATPase subunit